MKFNFIKEEKGSAMLIFALSLVVILGMAGLAIDGGVLYNTKSHLNKTANAAVLSGAQELTNSSEAVNDVVNTVLRAHDEEDSLKSTEIERDTAYSLKVTLEKEVPLNFMRLFKINSMKVSASSGVRLAPMARATGAVPLGIDESKPLEYMKEYILKVDSGDSEYGNFGILALSGPGAKLFEQDLMYGFDGEIEVGDILDTETGNVSGKTQAAVDYRLSLSSYADGDISHRDDPRIVLVLVYEPYSMESNQMKQVKVTGFAYFYIKAPVDENDATIRGYFIKRAGRGTAGDETVEDKGAYAIRLVE